jgi:hypothetical protein
VTLTAIAGVKPASGGAIGYTYAQFNDPAQGTGPYVVTYPFAINDSGEIVGWYYGYNTYGYIDQFGFKYKNGVFTGVSDPQGNGYYLGDETFPQGVNNAGWYRRRRRLVFLVLFHLILGDCL